MLLLNAKPMIIVIIAFIYVSTRFSTENCNDWPRTLVTGGCLLLVFAPDGATGNDDDDDEGLALLLIGNT